MSATDIPKDPTARWEWIKYQLRLRGTSTAKLARELNVTDRAIRNAKRTRYPRVERAIAGALSLSPAEIWPERWNADNTPLRQRPNRLEKAGTQTSYKNTGLCPIGHCKAARSA